MRAGFTGMPKNTLTSRAGRKLSKTQKPWVCSGCGRLIPTGSWGFMRSSLLPSGYERRRFCSDCQSAIDACDSVNIDACGENVVRMSCESCHGFRSCAAVEYLRNTKVGDLQLGDLDGIYQRNIEQRSMHLWSYSGEADNGAEG